MKQLRSGGSGGLCCPRGPGAGLSSLSHTGDVLRTVESSVGVESGGHWPPLHLPEQLRRLFHLSQVLEILEIGLKH